MVRYYGFFSNVSRGLRQKENVDGLIPCVVEPDEDAKPNRNWARLIQKLYEVHFLTCPKCKEPMRIICIIEEQEVIDKILGHLGLRQANRRPPPKLKFLEILIDYLGSQFPFYEEAFSDPDVFPDYSIG